MELRKILTGNYAGALVTTMVNLGIAEYIGLPKEPNLEEFKMVIDRAEKLHLDPSAITVLTALLREEKEVRLINTCGSKDKWMLAVILQLQS